MIPIHKESAILLTDRCMHDTEFCDFKCSNFQHDKCKYLHIGAYKL